MKIIHDWKWVLTNAWSAKLILLAAVLSGFEMVIQVMIAFEVHSRIPPGALSAAAGLVTMFAFVARFIAQQRYPNED